MTLFLLAAVLSAAEVPAARTSCCVRRAPLPAAAGSTALARLASAAPREKTALRNEVPLAAPAVAFLGSPEAPLGAAYAPPAIPPRTAVATARSERAPPYHRA